MQERIQLLLSTYNGEKYLPNLLNSLFSQTYQDWKLVIRDDGSTDNTKDILYVFCKKFNDKIILFKASNNNIGACRSFSELLKYSKAEYIMFCDQDDVWKPDKIELTYNKMLATERQHPGKPVLVHTDLEVVDEELNLISKSLWAYQRLSPGYGDDVYKISVQNVVTGCSVMINKKAKDISMPIPEEAIIHDWWIAVNVAKYGEIAYIKKPTILYRQHRKNEIGARDINLYYLLNRIFKFSRIISDLWNLYKMIRKLNFRLSLFMLIINKINITIHRTLLYNKIHYN